MRNANRGKVRRTYNAFVRFWELESSSKAGKTYKVSQRADGTFACSCESWKFARAPKPDCKHIKFIAAHLKVGLDVNMTPDQVTRLDAVLGSRVGMINPPVNSTAVRIAPPPEAIANPVTTRPVRKFRFDEE